jgi:PAS domain S-box-containing protein
MEPTGESYYRDICEHLGFIFIGVDRDLRIVFLNAEATKQLSYREIGAGRLILDLYEKEDRPAVQKLFDNTIQTRTSGETEVKLLHGDEDPKTFVLIVSPIVDQSGRCEGASASMRDISLRKQLSQELSRARRMGSLGKMAGAVAHHFNNILGGMLTSIDLAMHSESIRDIRNTLRMLAQSITRATRITNQLAAFAASENAREEFSELSTIMAAFQVRLKRIPKSANTEIVTHFDPVEAAQFESGRLLSVLESIAHNGIDAMHNGGVLTVDLRQDGIKAVITITDTGCGMSKEMLENLFEPFFTTKGELGGGTAENIGLSMAAVHGLVTEMGGRISVTSKLGQGTRVVLRLPLNRDAADSVSSTSQTPA